jgi:hypothetical protein
MIFPAGVSENSLSLKVDDFGFIFEDPLPRFNTAVGKFFLQNQK